MATELRAFFEIFFNTINEINENKTNTSLRNSELSIIRMLYSDILNEILKQLNKDDTINDAGNFQNNIVNGFQSSQNATSISQYLNNSINIIVSFSSKSKEIISDILDIILSDSFKKNESINRTRLYFKKIQFEILSRWKKSTNNDYDDDIIIFNNLINKHQINYSSYTDLFSIISILSSKDDTSMLELMKFYETLIKKYEKLDKVKKKINSKNIEKKEIKTDVPVIPVIPVVPVIKVKKERKTKEKIPASVKNTLWSLHFSNSLQGNCQCCKTEIISKNNFDCGHIISEKEGGKVELDNLKPICRSCNSSMGITNMNDYMKKYGFDKISIDKKIII